MKRYHLSTFIALTISILIIISTSVTSGILYFTLSQSITSEFEDKVRAECGEVSQFLLNQFRETENRLRELSLDNTIRVTLMLGVTQQLQEHLTKKYHQKNDTYFYIKPLDSKKIFGCANHEDIYHRVSKLIKSKIRYGDLKRDEKLGFTYSISHPVFRQKKQIGIAASIYLLNKDKSLFKFVKEHSNSTYIYLKNKQAWDLFSGRKIDNINFSGTDRKEKDLFYGFMDGEKIVAVKNHEIPYLYYIGKMDRLTTSKNTVLTLVLYSSLAVLTITIIISYFLSRFLVAPLSQLSKQALELADGRPNISQDVPTKIIEIEHLTSSLSTMVNQLRNTEKLKRYQQLFEGVTDPIFIYNFEGEFIELNKIASDQFGYSPEEFVNIRLSDLVPMEDLKRILNIIKEISNKGDRIVFETQILTKSGETIFAECHARKIVFKDQDVVLSVVRDITDRKQAEDKLRRSEERLSLALEVSLAGAWEYNTKSRKFSLDINQFKSLGYSEEEYLQERNDIFQIIDPNEAERAKSKFSEFVNSNSSDYFDDFLVITKDGEKRWMHNRAKAVQFEDNKPLIIIGTSIDITDLKRAEKALRDNEERYRTILNNRKIGYFEVDLAGNITFFNDALCELLEYNPDEILGLNYRSYTDKKTSKIIRKHYRKIFETFQPVEKLEYSIITKNGNSRELETSVSIIKDPNDKPVGFRGLTIDATDLKITEQQKKQLEKELRQAHKMEAIGTLAGGIAHDFNNILTGIFGYSQLAERFIEEPLKAKGHITQIIKGATRATALTQQILTFSRQTEHEKQPVNIFVVIKEALRLLRSTIPTSIDIKHKLLSKATIMADPTQIHQVIMNLCTNAYHAMRDSGGTLTVDLFEIDLPDHDKYSDVNLSAGKYLTVSVQDTGCGIDKDNLRKVFDPYFTTKQVGDGTGLGLAIVYGIIEDHGGFVRAKSVLNEGSEFEVFLPVVEVEDEALNQIENEKTLTGGSETIMFVDDEESILYSTQEYLMDYGYKVKTFTSAVPALEEFKKNPEQFDLVVTDMTMPKMTGDVFSKSVLEVRGDIPIILCTGYSDKMSEKKAYDIGILKYVQKPIESSNLLELIRDVLDGKES